MKNTIKFLAILVIISSFMSCEDLTDVTFDTSITERIDVNIPNTSGESAAFSAQNIIKLENGSGQIDDYLNYIKDVEIKKLSYKIINFSGDENGVVTVSFNVNGTLLKEHVAMNVKAVADSGEIFEVTDLQELNTIATAMKNSKQVTISYNGDAITNDTLNFKVEVTLELAITADPI